MSQVANAPTITVVGLGPAGIEHMTRAALQRIVSIPEGRGFLRTSRHPAAAELAAQGVDLISFDDVYEAAETVPDVYEEMVDRLIQVARERGDIVYAVPGSPAIGERSVRLLRMRCVDEGIPVLLLPGVSFVDTVLAAVGVDPLEEGVDTIDGETIGEQILGERPLLIAQCHSRSVLSDVKLALLEEFPADHLVAIVSDAGDITEAVDWLPISEMDRSEVAEPGPRTSVYVPPNPSPVAGSMRAFVDLVETLRGPDGCPWDAKQTHHSLTRHLIEEAYEVLEAIEALPAEAPRGAPDPDAYRKLEEELGDLLFQVAFHATLAKEAGAFTFGDVARGIHAKLVGRHPHVFGDLEVEGAAEVALNWEVIKAEEKERESLMDDITPSLPALLHAAKTQRRAASVGFDWPYKQPVVEKLHEEIDELARASGPEVEAELGDVLFSVVNLARHLEIDPESALRVASLRFAERFRRLERLARERNVDMKTSSLEQLDLLWEEAKAGG